MGFSASALLMKQIYANRTHENKITSTKWLFSSTNVPILPTKVKAGAAHNLGFMKRWRLCKSEQWSFNATASQSPER
jgi:hypothetical protein